MKSFVLQVPTKKDRHLIGAWMAENVVPGEALEKIVTDVGAQFHGLDVTFPFVRKLLKEMEIEFSDTSVHSPVSQALGKATAAEAALAELQRWKTEVTEELSRLLSFFRYASQILGSQVEKLSSGDWDPSWKFEIPETLQQAPSVETSVCGASETPNEIARTYRELGEALGMTCADPERTLKQYFARGMPGKPATQGKQNGQFVVKVCREWIDANVESSRRRTAFPILLYKHDLTSWISHSMLLKTKIGNRVRVLVTVWQSEGCPMREATRAKKGRYATEEICRWLIDKHPELLRNPDSLKLMLNNS